jgi:hypothetical protein
MPTTRESLDTVLEAGSSCEGTSSFPTSPGSIRGLGSVTSRSSVACDGLHDDVMARVGSGSVASRGSGAGDACRDDGVSHLDSGTSWSCDNGHDDSPSLARTKEEEVASVGVDA